MTATYDTTVNTAISNILAVFQTVAAASSPFGPAGQQSGIQVVDGVPIEYAASYMMVVEGFSNWKQEWFTVGSGFDRLEEYDIDCLIHCWQGDTDPAGRRAEAFSLLAAVRAQFYAQLTAGGAAVLGLPMAADAAIVSGRAVQGPAGEASGWGIDLNFVVHVENVILS